MKLTDKKFWENYWYYYKIHTIAGIIGFTVIATQLYQCATTVKPDISVMYIGYPPIISENLDSIQNSFAEIAGDINKNGKKSTLFYNVIASLKEKSEMNLAGIQKADLEIAVGESSLIFVSKELVKRYIDMETFSDITDVAKNSNTEEEKLIKDANGKYCVVNISNTPFYSRLGLENLEIYMGIRVPVKEKMNNANYMLQYNKSKEIFEKILNGSLK